MLMTSIPIMHVLISEGIPHIATTEGVVCLCRKRFREFEIGHTDVIIVW